MSEHDIPANAETLAKVAAIADDNLNTAQMLADPPPQMERSLPPLSSLGLGAVQAHMSENAFNTFITIMHWSIMVQDMFEGKPIKWTNETFSGMGAAFVGFGNADTWDMNMRNSIGKIVHAHYINWQGDTPHERQLRRLPHRLLTEVAPLMANQSRGWSHFQAVKDLVADPTRYANV